MNRFHTVALGRSSVVLDTAVGHLRRLALGELAPLHTAPWVNDEPIVPDTGTAPTEQALSGDFLCAPFCANDVNGGPIHGWTANAPWSLADEAAGSASFVLSRDVQGARVTKTLSFREGEPFLYQRHDFTGGTGEMPIGHHAMIRVAGTAALSFSPKQLVFTPPDAPERDPSRGRSLLAYPTSGPSLSAIRFADGRPADLGTYPFAERHEDIVSMAEAGDSPLGWTAAVRDAENDIVLLLRDARTFPCTSLWMSNGGRDYAPWNGRHTRVLGLEDTRSYGTAGHRAGIGPNPMREAGLATAFDLGTDPVLRYAIGAIQRPAGWTRIAGITLDGDGLTLTDASGATITVPCSSDMIFGD